MGRKVAENLGIRGGAAESRGGVRGESSGESHSESRGANPSGEAFESLESLARRLEAAENRALKALKIALLSLAVAAFLGILSLWVLLNQVTISAGIDKKLIAIERALGLEKAEKGEKAKN